MMTQESALGRRRTLALGGHNVPVGPTPEVGSLYVSLRNSIGHHRVFASRLASSGNIRGLHTKPLDRQHVPTIRARAQ
jgi:hypothetical protein